MKKRMLSAALVLCMLLTLLPVSALAADTMTGDGTEGSPYQITTVEQFLSINNSRNYYQLQNDLKLTPITDKASYISAFSGTLDGNSHTISGLSIAGQMASVDLKIGLIGELKRDGVVKNLSVSGSIALSNNANGGRYGGVAGWNYGEITDCSFSGVITTDDGDEATTESGYNHAVGGISGRSDGTILDCVNHGNLTGRSYQTGSSWDAVYAGGITGSNHGDLSRCTNNGTVLGEVLDGETFYGDIFGSDSWQTDGGYVGGIAGDTEKGKITNCTNDGYASAITGNGKGNLVSVPALDTIQVESAADQAALEALLPDKIHVITDKGDRLMPPAWALNDLSFPLNGTVTLTGNLDITDDSPITNTNSVSTEFTVEVQVAAKPVLVTGVTLDASTAALKTGETKTLTATVAPADASNKALAWTSSNTAVATVDSSGKVTAVAPGTATITAAAQDGSGQSGSCTVTVTALTVPVTGVTLDASTAALKTGKTKTLTATVAPANASNKALTWTSSDPTVATVSNGLVTAVAPGTATITAAAQDGSGKSGSCTVTVTASPVTGGVGGTVTDENDSAFAGATVAVKTGGTTGTQVGSTATTGSDGKFSFTGLPYGVYSLVATRTISGGSDNQTITKSIVVGAVTADGDMKFPSGKTNTVVEVKPSTPDVAADGLDELFDAANTVTEGDKGVTSDDLTKVTGGGSIVVKLTAEKKEENEVSGDAGKLKGQLSAKQELGLYLDLSVLKTVTESGNPTPATTRLTELPELVTVMMELPADLQGKTGLTVLRVHGGIAQTLPTSGPGEYFTVDGSYLTMHVQKFSTYALAYTTTGGDSGDSGSGSSGGGGGGSVSSYTITATAGTGGKISPSGKVSVSRNSSKTFTITPDAGYEISSLLVDGKAVGAVGSYTFEKVTSAHTIEARFVQGGTQPKDFPFTDVAPDDWFRDGVEYVYENGLMNGTSDTTFSPYLTTTRGMIVTILWRAEGGPTANGSSPFTDVTEGSYCHDAVIWGASNGIVKGYGNGNYGPEDLITREQLAAILWRYAQYQGMDVSVGENTNILSYTDFDQISGYAVPALQWACGAGLVTGRNGGILDPKGQATRAEAAVILYRMLEN